MTTDISVMYGSEKVNNGAWGKHENNPYNYSICLIYLTKLTKANPELEDCAKKVQSVTNAKYSRPG